MEAKRGPVRLESVMWRISATLNGALVPLCGALSVVHALHGDTVVAIIWGGSAVLFLVSVMFNLLTLRYVSD